MKVKKLKELFRAVEAISTKYTPEQLHAQESDYGFMTESGATQMLTLIPNTGKYVVPETVIINKIVRSIPVDKLTDEVIKINEAAGMPLVALMKDSNSDIDYMLFIHTAKGAIGYAIRVIPDVLVPPKKQEPEVSNIDENGQPILSDQEIDILKQMVLQ